MQKGRATTAAAAARHGRRGRGREGGPRQGDRGRRGAPGLEVARQRRRNHHVKSGGAASEFVFALPALHIATLQIATPLFPRETTISATCEVKAETDPKRRNELARSL